MVNKLTLDKWKRMLPSERENWALQLVGELPSGFAFRSIRLYKLGTTSHHVAEFEFDGSSFVLIPGGVPLLGYDANRLWEPTPEELESWRGTLAEYGIDCTIQEYIASVTLRPRVVHIRSLLMETIAQKSCDARLHRDFVAQLEKSGFRFPTSDEWEYACGAGVPTLFRWGDRVPCDRYPNESNSDEAAWRRQSAVSGGKLEFPPERFSSEWDLHRQPNAFGIYIASNPYHYELVAEPEITRGGDGGSTICGGAGFFLSWLTLATAHFEPDVCQRNPTEPIDIRHAIGRRVLPLS